jgi:hypothetical protein
LHGALAGRFGLFVGDELADFGLLSVTDRLLERDRRAVDGLPARSLWLAQVGGVRARPGNGAAQRPVGFRAVTT